MISSACSAGSNFSVSKSFWYGYSVYFSRNSARFKPLFIYTGSDCFWFFIAIAGLFTILLEGPHTHYLYQSCWEISVREILSRRNYDYRCDFLPSASLCHKVWAPQRIFNVPPASSVLKNVFIFTQCRQHYPNSSMQIQKLPHRSPGCQGQHWEIFRVAVVGTSVESQIMIKFRRNLFLLKQHCYFC